MHTSSSEGADGFMLLQANRTTLHKQQELLQQKHQLEARCRELGVDLSVEFNFTQTRTALNPAAQYVKAVLQLDAITSMRQQSAVFLATISSRDAITRATDDSMVEQLQRQISSLRQKLGRPESDLVQGSQWWKVGAITGIAPYAYVPPFSSYAHLASSCTLPAWSFMFCNRFGVSCSHGIAALLWQGYCISAQALAYMSPEYVPLFEVALSWCDVWSICGNHF
jgi:hypothetical protein